MGPPTRNPRCGALASGWMSKQRLTIIETRTDESGVPEVETFSIRPGPLGAVLSVLLGLIALVFAFFLLIPLMVLAVLLVVLWILVAWIRSTSARLFGRGPGASRRNVRVVGPDRSS